MKLINIRDYRDREQKDSVIKKLCSTACFCLVIFMSHMNLLQAKTIQPIEEIQYAAKKFLEEMHTSADNENIEIVIGNIDPRLRLVQCEQPLEAYSPQATRRNGKTSVAIKCTGPVAWKIIVPAKITEYQLAWVVNRRVFPGDLLNKRDISQKRVPINYTRKEPLLNKKQMLNASPKKVMRSGSIIYQDSICLVCRGDKVSVTADNQFLSINVEGIALSDAILGETVQVRNTRTKKSFGAVVTGKNRLSVNIAGSK
ncbi:flagellar basal body P-ring formation chaperone FlgA [Aliikangiella sp. IMCC44359]|uniref:flagellar basal body P-ring formation chaperone FlgA n=1 Tax=Aliikangiella sp. IMCC44359 TaxID=3459125 RepID=UPI00403B0665